MAEVKDCEAPDCFEVAPYRWHERYVCVHHIVWAAGQPAKDPLEQVHLASGWREVHDGER